MPKGPGTYGSKVGRPPKRKKYDKGGKTSASKGNPHKRTRFEALKDLAKKYSDKKVPKREGIGKFLKGREKRLKKKYKPA